MVVVSDVPEAERLATFVANLRQLVSHCEANQAALFTPTLREALAEVWPTFYRRAQQVETRLREWPSDKLEDLRDVGLSGPELAVKLAGFQDWYHAFYTATAEPISAPPPRAPMFAWFPRKQPEKQTSPVERSLGPLKYAFKWANIILGSLAKALPIAEPLKELKEVIERGIEDGEAKRLRSSGNPIFGTPKI